MDITACILKGSRTACEKYRAMVGSSYPPPEFFVQSVIALELAKHFPYVALEATARGLREEAGISSGRIPRDSPSGRVDIVVYWKKGDPRALIEVKRAWENAKCNLDARRLKSFVDHSSSRIRSGFLVVYADARKAETVTARYETISEQTGFKQVGLAGPFEDDEGTNWGIGCFEHRQCGA